MQKNHELFQLFNEQGLPIPGKGASKNEVFGMGLLHAAAHVWIWRIAAAGAEVLLQKRAPEKRTWPNRYDISAAGHLSLGESPLDAALRESEEEIGLEITVADLYCIAVHRAHLLAGEKDIENEFQWVYTLELPSEVDFTLRSVEVSSVEWKPLKEFTQEVKEHKERYVPHSDLYYETVVDAINRAAKDQTSIS